MSDNHFDLIVIGTGPAASTVARKANQNGKRVAIVEERQFGGTCALRGCNPKKVYTNAAALVDQARRAEGTLASFGDVRIDWSNLLAFKKTFTQPVIEKSEASFAKYGISTFHGTAAFVDVQTVRVCTEERSEDLTGHRIFIGTGAKPVELEIPGAEHVLRSDAFMELSSLPKRIVFIGGGYISMEFAHVAHQAGAKVTVIDRNERILKGFDPDLVAQLTQWSVANGIEVKTNAAVSAVEQNGEQSFVVHFDNQGQTETVLADLVVHGAGRKPNLDRLNLEAANIAFQDDGIEVDKFMRSTTNAAIFTGGDCAASGQPRLTPVANEEARIVSRNLFQDDPTETPDYGAVPRVVFSGPSLAAVGQSEEEARREAVTIDVRHEVTSEWNSVRKSAHGCAAYKVILDPSGQILGAHLLGPAAEETINLFALAIKFGLTAQDLKSTLFAFPTFASDVRQMV